MKRPNSLWTKDRPRETSIIPDKLWSLELIREAHKCPSTLPVARCPIGVYFFLLFKVFKLFFVRIIFCEITKMIQRISLNSFRGFFVGPQMRKLFKGENYLT